MSSSPGGGESSDSADSSSDEGNEDTRKIEFEEVHVKKENENPSPTRMNVVSSSDDESSSGSGSSSGTSSGEEEEDETGDLTRKLPSPSPPLPSPPAAQEEEEGEYEAEGREEAEDGDEADNEDEAEDGDNEKVSTVSSSKRKLDDDFDDEDSDEERLEDDDYDLLEENLGIKVVRNKYKRVRRIVDDDSSDDDSPDAARNERDIIADQLFDRGDDDDETQSRQSTSNNASHAGFVETYQSDESDEEEDDFIVDDDNNATRAGGRTRIHGLSYEDEVALREAQDVFGTEFDYADLQKQAESEESGSEDEYDGEGRRMRKSLRGVPTKPMKELFEPSQLERFGISEHDDKLRKCDIPERFQIRPIPLTTATPEELEEEAGWICENYFKNRRDELFCGDEEALKENIQTLLHYIRNEQYEVPYIAYYRTEEISPYLQEEAECWKVYKADADFASFIQKKRTLVSLARSIQQYQGSIVVAHGSIPEGMQVMKDEYIEEMCEFQRLDQITDMTSHIRFFYARELEAIKEKEEILQARQAVMENQEHRAPGSGGEQSDDNDNELQEINNNSGVINGKKLKKSSSISRYSSYKKAGLGQLVSLFGVEAHKLGESMRDGYQRFEIGTPAKPPQECASEFTTQLGSWASPVMVLQAAKYMLATEISKDYNVRQTVRETFFKKAELTVFPTPKGMKLIDENHPVISYKFLKNKPVTELQGDEFLKLTMAEEDKLLVIQLGEDVKGKEGKLVDELLEFSKDDAYSAITNLWNAERVEAGRMALEKLLLPELRKQLRVKLLNDACAYVLKQCSEKFTKMIESAPFRIETSKPSNPDDPDAEEDARDSVVWYKQPKCRVLAIAYSDEPDLIAFACVLNEKGHVMGHIRLKHILTRIWSEAKSKEMIALGHLMTENLPHIVVIAGSSRKARSLRFEVNEILKQIRATVDDEEMLAHFESKIPVEILDPELAKLVAQSADSRMEFPDFPTTLKEAISLGRRIQDPITEFAQLCNYDKEILHLHLHPLQGQLSEDELLSELNIRMTRKVAEIGIDINDVVFQQHKRKLLQFCPGFGPAKATGFINMMMAKNMKLENRVQLIDRYKFGPVIFMNCSAYIKISPEELGDDAFIDLLDTTRIHPQQYDMARKVAKDACCGEDEDEDEDEDSMLPQIAVEEVMHDPSKVDTLNLVAFINNLVEQEVKNPTRSVEIIKVEIKNPYNDYRPPMQFLTREEEFYLLAKETPETFHVGKLVTAKVVGVERISVDSLEKNTQVPDGDEASQPIRLGPDLYKCPFCYRDNFTYDGMLIHFEPGECPGRPKFIKLTFDNTVSGELELQNLSDRKVDDRSGCINPDARVRPGMTIHCRILEIDYAKFSVKCSSKSSDLNSSTFTPPKDLFYDEQREEEFIQKAKEETKTAKKVYVRRLIVHPSFKNVTYADAEKLMEQMEQGEVIVRPSSKGVDHLTVTWKVADGVYQHVDVIEKDKESAYCLGRKLWIGNDEFDDLDEIIARYINAMAANVRDILNYRYYVHRFTGADKKLVEDYLREMQQKNSNKIHYVIYAYKQCPGKFILAYLPTRSIHYEHITVMPEGFQFRQLVFGSFECTLKWFKEHYTQPPPPSTPALASVPSFQPCQRAPSIIPIFPRAPRSVLSICNDRGDRSSRPLSVVGGMAGLAATMGRNYITTRMTTPYTPSAPTPYMTPYQQHPSAPATPRYTAAAAAGPYQLDPVTGGRYTTMPGSHAFLSVKQSGGGGGGGRGVAGEGFRQAAESWAKLQQKGRPSSVATPASTVDSTDSPRDFHVQAYTSVDPSATDPSPAASFASTTHTIRSMQLGGGSGDGEESDYTEES